MGISSMPTLMRFFTDNLLSPNSGFKEATGDGPH
jgi:hypothetical protein